MRARRPFLIASVLILFVSNERAASGRPIEVPTFPVDPGAEVVGLRVAAGTDGTLVFLWRGSGDTVWSQWFSPTGAALSAPVVIGSGTRVRIGADTRGGYLVAIKRVIGQDTLLFGRRLDSTGQPLGDEFQVNVGDPGDIIYFDVVGLPTGSFFVWHQDTQGLIRIYDPQGLPRGDAILVGESGWGFPITAAALADGGIVVVWHDPSIHRFFSRTFDADGTFRLGPVFLASPSLFPHAIVGTAGGGFAAIGVVGSFSIHLARFTEQMTLLDETTVDTLSTTEFPTAACATDAAGRWHVVWTGKRYNEPLTQFLGYLTPHARPLAADATPLEPSFELSDIPASEIVTARLASGSFVNAWTSPGTPGEERGYASIVSLCAPDMYVCGDGVLDPRCEECDDGAANNDTAPDACRTNCSLPRCGDGTTDSGESCDNGGQSICEGCDEGCQVVVGLACGDGIVVPGCADQCDDANTIAGDGCAPDCTLERVRGGGRTTTDCYTEWVVNNPANLPLHDRRGGFSRKQSCVDDDPRCDFDGGTPGSCTFRLRVCANNTDVPGCTPPTQLGSWDLVSPSAARASRDPALAQVRASFAGVAEAILGSAADVCSTFIDVVVPMRGTSAPFGRGRLNLKSSATTSMGGRDRDGLRLLCLPPG